MKIKGKLRVEYLIQMIIYPVIMGLLIALTVYLKVYVISVLFSVVIIIGLINLYGEAFTKIEIEDSIIYLNRNKKSERKIDIKNDIITTRFRITTNNRGYKGYEYLNIKCKNNIEFDISQNMFRNYKDLKHTIYKYL